MNAPIKARKPTWGKLHEGDPDPFPNDTLTVNQVCPHKGYDDVYMCCRPRGHAGPHVATDGVTVVESWTA